MKFASADWNKLVFSDKKKAQTQGCPDNVHVTVSLAACNKFRETRRQDNFLSVKD